MGSTSVEGDAESDLSSAATEQLETPATEQTPLLPNSSNRGSESLSGDIAGQDRDDFEYTESDTLVSTDSSSYGSAIPETTTSEAPGSADDDEDNEDDEDNAPKPTFLIDTNRTRFWLCFAEVMLSYFIACFDGTIMASSHPVITSYFHSSNSASWLSTAFLLTSTAFQPLVGRLSDSLGRKPLYVGTMAVFGAATAWCALAQSMVSFIAARAVCGLGAGGMMTLGAIIVSDLVPIERRGGYQAYLNITYGVGSSMGAALGGAMADYLGWRWEFGVQVPLLAVGVILAIIALPNDLGLQGRKRESLRVAMGAFDFRGSILLTLSTVFFILALNLGGNVLPWGHPFVITSLTVFAVCFPLFSYCESFAKRPIMPLYLIKNGPHMNLIFANSIAAFLTHAIIFNIPLFFQGVLLTSATTSGLHLVVPTVVSSLAGTATGFLVTRTRRLKWPLATGTLLYLAGTLSLASLRPSLPPLLYPLALVPAAAGQGFQFPGTFLAVLAASPQAQQAVVTSTLVLWRSLGMMLGIAASSFVVQTALVHYLDCFVHGEERDDVVARVRRSVEAVRDLPVPYREMAVQSYEAALRATFLSLAVLAVLGVVLILPVRLPRLGSPR